VTEEGIAGVGRMQAAEVEPVQVGLGPHSEAFIAGVAFVAAPVLQIDEELVFRRLLAVGQRPQQHVTWHGSQSNVLSAQMNPMIIVGLPSQNSRLKSPKPTL